MWVADCILINGIEVTKLHADSYSVDSSEGSR